MWHLLFNLFGGFQLSKAVSLICYNGTIDNYQVATLDNAAILINTSCIDVSLPTIIYTFGYRGQVNGNRTRRIITACLGDTIKRNCVLLDWEKEASTETVLGVETIEASYALKAVPNSISIGKRMGQVLIELANYHLNLTRVILMGHSLGSHLWGNTGREVKSNGMELGIIAGLDPAGPLYNTTFLRVEPLNAKSAKFVYCVHTDPGVYGINSSECTVDIWPNFNHFINSDNLQPGCENGTFPKFSTEDLCSHDRVIILLEYSMSVNKTALEASKAPNYFAWAAANGTTTETIYIGDLINTKATPGNYYLSTNPPLNYGKGKDGLRP